jgi:hypothetical protein
MEDRVQRLRKRIALYRGFLDEGICESENGLERLERNPQKLHQSQRLAPSKSIYGCAP